MDTDVPAFVVENDFIRSIYHIQHRFNFAFCRQNLDSIAMSMQGKMMEIRARQEGQRHRAAAEGTK